MDSIKSFGMKQLHIFNRFSVAMADIIRRIISSIHVAFLPQKSYIDPSLSEFESKVFGNLEMETLSSDRYNMHGDVQRLKGDFKKAVRKYKDTAAVHG